MLFRGLKNGGSSDTYDIGIVATGFESRCTFALKELGRRRFDELYVIGFEERRVEESRIKADAFFSLLDPTEMLICSSSDASFAAKILGERLSAHPHPRIFVDYSSMPRAWYGAILNYLRSTQLCSNAILDLSYTPGLHEGEKTPVEVKGITTIPGFEGVSSGSARTATVFSLGFDKWLPYAALERVQPNEIFCVVAEPGGVPEYTGRALTINKHLFEELGIVPFAIDIRDVEQYFTFLTELIALKLHQTCDVALVGMGPKPHTLGMCLAAIRFQEAAVVQVERRATSVEDIKPIGERITTQVMFESS
ncbi:MAG: hypothetical protein U1E67_08970 [Hyphomicrobiales bacterium]